MANFRSAEYLPAALDSVLAQTVHGLEVIVSDDASPDGSAGVVRQYMARDPRVQLIVAKENSGPAAARNRAMEAARGEWIAIVDSDDIVHPERFEILISAAEALGADGIADDLLLFSEAGAGGTLFGNTTSPQPRQITPADFIRSNTSGTGLPPLGYVKPLFKREKLASLTYDEAVRIGEDYDFLLRFLLAGGRFFILPEPLYLYRRHSQSISHRLSESTVLAMISNQERLIANHGSFPPELDDLLEKRMAALRSSLSFERLVLSLKERRAMRALRLVAANPGLMRPLARSVLEGMQSRFKRNDTPARRSSAVVLHSANQPPPDADLLRTALGNDESIETVAVPPYMPPANRSLSEGEARAVALRLAAMAMQSDLRVVCHGLAGIHAAGFLPRKQIVMTVVPSQEELGRMLDWPASSGSRLILSETASRAAPDLDTIPFCPGYRLLTERENTSKKPKKKRAADAGT